MKQDPQILAKSLRQQSMFDSSLSATQLNLVRTMTADSMVNSGAAQDRGSEVLQKQHTGSIKPRPSEKITLNR